MREAGCDMALARKSQQGRAIALVPKPENNPGSEVTMVRSLKIAAALIAIAAVVFLATWSPSLHGVEGIRQTLLGYGPWAVLVSSGLMILQSTIAPLPANVTIVANGLVFGPFWGGLLSWVTILIGASLCFGLSKKFGKPFAARFAGQSLATAEKFFDKYGLPAMFVIRVAPFIPFDAVSYVAGLAGVPYWRFFL